MPRISKIDYAIQPISFYKFCCLDGDIESCYVGSTSNFTVRKYKHKSVCNNVKSKNHNLLIYKTIREHGGWDNWSMIELSSQLCESKRAAERIEQDYMNLLKSNMNSRKAIMTQEERVEYQTEYQKQYRQDNKEKILEDQKQYYIDNKERLVEYQKQYDQDNKDQIAEYQKQYRQDNKETLAEKKKQIITCECGCETRQNDIAKHRRSNKHINLMSLIKK